MLALLILFSFLYRDMNKDKEAGELIDEDDVELGIDEDYLHLIKVC